jgi:cytoskeletal protein RodZ
MSQHSIQTIAAFQEKDVPQTQTLGDRLKEVRCGEGVSILEVSRALKINALYLEALERGQYHLLPGGIYTENFLKRYAGYLGLHERRVLERFAQEDQIYRRVREPDQRDPYDFVQEATRHPIFALSPVFFQRLAIVGVILGIVVYLGFQVRSIVEPPALVVLSPSTDFVTQDATVVVEGTTEKESEVVINGQGVLTNEEGAFREEVDLQTGVNVLTVTARKEHSRDHVVTRRILVK